MKFSIDIECSPQEARQFLGLPDVEALQAGLMEQIRDRMSAHVAAMDPDALMKIWLPIGARAWETFQDAFTKGFAKPPPGDSDK